MKLWPWKSHVHQEKYFQKMSDVNNTFLPGYDEDYIWDIVYSPGILQSWRVNHKTEEMEGRFGRNLFLWKQAESFSLYITWCRRKGKKLEGQKKKKKRAKWKDYVQETQIFQWVRVLLGWRAEEDVSFRCAFQGQWGIFLNK